MNAALASRAAKALEEARQGRPRSMDRLMRMALPFNRPHRIRIAAVTQEQVEISLPSRRSNRNHLGGMHACAIATALEFGSGASILLEVGMQEYRIIMSRLEIDYLAKPKGDCVVRAQRNTPDVLGLTGVLESEGVARIVQPSSLYDASGEHCAEAAVHWHLKAWGNRP